MWLHCVHATMKLEVAVKSLLHPAGINTPKISFEEIGLVPCILSYISVVIQSCPHQQGTGTWYSQKGIPFATITYWFPSWLCGTGFFPFFALGDRVILVTRAAEMEVPAVPAKLACSPHWIYWISHWHISCTLFGESKKASSQLKAIKASYSEL